MANRKVKRNTSKQIISYTLDPEGTDSYGTVKFAASKTVYGKDGFNKVLYRQPTELVNADPSLELTIINEEKLELRTVTLDPFIDKFSATYLIPTSLAPKGNVFKSVNFPNGIQDASKNQRPNVFQKLPFTKTLSGQSQKTEGRYTITRELIETGRDLKITWKIQGWNAAPFGDIVSSTQLKRFRYGSNVTTPQASFGVSSWISLDPSNTSNSRRFHLKGQYIIRNADMDVDDEWELQGSSKRMFEIPGTLAKVKTINQSVYSDRCAWEIEVVESGTGFDQELARSIAVTNQRVVNRQNELINARILRLEKEEAEAERIRLKIEAGLKANAEAKKAAAAKATMDAEAAARKQKLQEYNPTTLQGAVTLGTKLFAKYTLPGIIGTKLGLFGNKKR